MKLYSVYNGFNNSLFDEDEVIEAKSGRQAVEKLLKKLNIKYTSIKF